MYARPKAFCALFLLVLVGWTCRAPQKTQAAPGLWRVGVARTDITPQDSLWMAGYAARKHAARGTLQRLWAKALALQDSLGHRAVLVTTDLIGFPKAMSDTIRQRCQRRFGLSRAQILLNSSHTHTGPVLRGRWYHTYPMAEAHIAACERYSERLEDTVVRLVGEALEDLRPAVLLSGNGVVRFQVNRRNNGRRIPLELQAELAGPSAHDVPVLMARSPEGNTLAVAFGYACHPTVLNFYQWSGDYPGFAQSALEADMPGVTALFFQGCGGDQNPLPRRSVGLARQYGRELAAAVHRVLEEGLRPLRPLLRTAYREVELFLTEPPSRQQLQALADSLTGYQKRWAEHMLKRLDAGDVPESYPYPISLWLLGDQLLVALGGEPVVDYAISLKWLFGQGTFVLGYSNDVMGYIPSVRVLREGGYEGATSQMAYDMPSTWRADLEVRILHSVLDMAGELGVTLPVRKLLE